MPNFSHQDTLKLQELLQKYFNLPQFRGQQLQVIQTLLQGNSVLALMPTGQGKSLCYQFLAQTRPGLVVVISPLIALIEDQTYLAQKLSIAATGLHSAMSSQERSQRLKHLSEQKYNLLFVTPERFRKTDFIEALQNNTIQLLAIDEAHCISQWGHDFRPDYSKLAEVHSLLNHPPILALTATATPDVQKDIIQQLKTSLTILSSGVERSNLSLSVHEIYSWPDKYQWILEFLKSNPGPGLIYVTLIDSLKKLSRFLHQHNIQHGFYHGDLAASERQKQQTAFLQETTNIMLATPAFGLGVDKKNIRWILHTEIPGSLESYYQEIGRAGRDGKNSSTHLLWDEDDVSIQMEFIKWSHPESAYVEQVYKLLCHHPDRIQSEGLEYLRQQMSFKNRRDYRLDSSLKILQRIGVLQFEIQNTEEEKIQYKILSDLDLVELKKINSAEHLSHQNLKLLKMLQWCNNKSECRLLQIYEYFGHKSDEPCGQCDNCLSSL